MSDKEYLTLQARRNTHIGRYLIELNRSFIGATLEYLKANGFATITPHHIHIIAQIDVAGSPIAEVLARSGVTKQSLSNTLAVLEANDLIKKVASKSDGRSRHIKFTEQGLKLLRVGIAAVDEVESQYAEVLGAERFQDLKQILGELHTKVVRN